MTRYITRRNTLSLDILSIMRLERDFIVSMDVQTGAYQHSSYTLTNGTLPSSIREAFSLRECLL
jgi:hypothetical protein